MRQLSRTPIAIMYESGMPGHGDKALSERFIEVSRDMGHPVSVLTAPESHEYVWGERMAWRLRGFLDWAVAHSDPKSVPDQQAASREASFGDGWIKSKLLRGFVVDQASFGGQGWLHDWGENYRRWRSDDLPTMTARPPAGGLILRRVVVRNASDWRCYSELHGHVPEGESFFALFLHAKSGGRSDLLVAEHGPTPDYYPRIDPLLDGCFRGSVWFFQDGSWRQGDVW